MDTTPIDVTSPEAMESLRRSVAMLSPDQWALRREVALRVLGALVDHLRDAQTAPGS